MALINTKKSLFLLKSGATLGDVSNFLEVNDEFVINPNITTEEFNRMSGKLGTIDSYVDTCHITLNQSISHKMRSSNAAATALDTAPLYGELLKIGGFDEHIDTSKAGEEFVVYTNTQAPQKGSLTAYVDGQKFTLTNGVVADVTFNFEVGKPANIDATLQGFIDNKAIPTAEANPPAVLSDEPQLIVSCGDIITAGGDTVSADKITLTMGAKIDELYALGLKEFNLNDYVIKLTADFYVDSTKYADAITKLNNETAEIIEIKLGTDQTGSLINGKSVSITASVAKASAFTDSVDKSKLKRSFTWILRPDANDINLMIKHGFFA